MFERKHSHMFSNMGKMLQGWTVMAVSCTASKYLFVKWQRWRKWSLTLFCFWKHRPDWPCPNNYHSSWKCCMHVWKLWGVMDDSSHWRLDSAILLFLLLQRPYFLPHLLYFFTSGFLLKEWACCNININMNIIKKHFVIVGFCSPSINMLG